MTDTPKPSIHECMAAAMREIGHIGKDHKNDHFRFHFRGIDDIYNNCHTPLANNNIYITQKVLNATYEPNGPKQIIARLTIKYRFNGPAGDHISTTVIAEAMDQGDKATSKAYSMALKTAMLQTFMIPIEGADDPDAHSPIREPEPKPAPARQQPKPDWPKIAAFNQTTTGALLQEAQQIAARHAQPVPQHVDEITNDLARQLRNELNLKSPNGRAPEHS